MSSGQIYLRLFRRSGRFISFMRKTSRFPQHRKSYLMCAFYPAAWRRLKQRASRTANALANSTMMSTSPEVWVRLGSGLWERKEGKERSRNGLWGERGAGNDVLQTTLKRRACTTQSVKIKIINLQTKTLKMDAAGCFFVATLRTFQYRRRRRRMGKILPLFFLFLSVANFL